jgi:hypothetical protein
MAALTAVNPQIAEIVTEITVAGQAAVSHAKSCEQT